MSLTKVSYSMIQGGVINALDYIPAGTTDYTTSLQAAIDAATAARKILRLPAGTYTTSGTLNLLGNNWLIGDGKDGTIITYSGIGSAIKCSGWGGKIQGLTVNILSAASNGIEVGTDSRNCSIEDVYLSATASGATQTGAGFYLNAETGFSGGLTISTSYALQFKYGVKMVGTNIATGTWTSVCIYNLWVVGYGSGALAGSAGIYMDALTNGIGTCMYGGTIESMYYGIYVADDSFGGNFNTDMEGNTVDYLVGNAFTGSITSAFNVPAYSAARNGSGGAFWNRYQLVGGVGPKQENYFSPKYQIYTGSSDIQSVDWYHSSGSLIDMTMTEPHKLKFSFGLGSNGTYGIDGDPSNHYIQVDDRKIHWDAISPAAQVGAQIVAWVQGSVCYNATASVGQPIGWMCTVSGTPGTWVAMANL